MSNGAYPVPIHNHGPVDGAGGRGSGDVPETPLRRAVGREPHADLRRALRRTGGGVRPGFEGGQMPLFQRLPKRGFTNINRKDYAVINLDRLNSFDEGTEVTPELLLETGAISKLKAGVKILGNGKLEKKLTVKANKFSASAKEAIEAAGGQTEVI